MDEILAMAATLAISILLIIVFMQKKLLDRANVITERRKRNIEKFLVENKKLEFEIKKRVGHNDLLVKINCELRMKIDEMTKSEIKTTAAVDDPRLSGHRREK